MLEIGLTLEMYIMARMRKILKRRWEVKIYFYIFGGAI